MKIAIVTDSYHPHMDGVIACVDVMEELLNSKRFIRISQSEIINLYKVKHFDINIAGTIGIEFDDGTKSWASRSRVKAIKDMLM